MLVRYVWLVAAQTWKYIVWAGCAKRFLDSFELGTAQRLTPRSAHPILIIIYRASPKAWAMLSLSLRCKLFSSPGYAPRSSHFSLWYPFLFLFVPPVRFISILPTYYSTCGERDYIIVQLPLIIIHSSTTTTTRECAKHEEVVPRQLITTISLTRCLGCAHSARGDKGLLYSLPSSLSRARTRGCPEWTRLKDKQE